MSNVKCSGYPQLVILASLARYANALAWRVKLARYGIRQKSFVCSSAYQLYSLRLCNFVRSKSQKLSFCVFRSLQL